MTEGEQKMIEIMSLVLDELREIKKEQRQMKEEMREMKEEMREIKGEMRTMNTRLGALEYVVREERVEFRSRIERLESAVAKAGLV